MHEEVGIGRMPPLVVDLDPPRSMVRRALPVALGSALDRLVLSGRPSAPVLDLVSGEEVRVRLRPDLTGPDVESRLRPVDRSQGLVPRSPARSWFR